MGKLENEENSAISDRAHQSLNYFCPSVVTTATIHHCSDDVTIDGIPELNNTLKPKDSFQDGKKIIEAGHSSDDDFELDDGYLEPFLHQVGGHGSVLSWDQCTVCKPYSSREQNFYEILPLEFKEFVPEYKGVVEIGLIEQNGGTLLLNANPADMAPKDENGNDNVENKNLSTLEKNADKRGSMRKCESSNSLTKCRSIGRIHSRRSGSLELEIFSRKRNKFNGSPVSNTKKSSPDQQLFNDAHLDDQLNSVAPSESSGVTTSGTPKPCLYPQNPWALQCQTRQLTKMHRKIGEKQKFLMLENLVCNFNLPCVLDLKMGYRQYGDDASPAKRDSQVRKCRNSTSAVLGVRMCGMQVYHADSGIFKCYNKYSGRALSVEGFKREMFKFWHNGLTFRSDLLPGCIEKLKALKELISQADGYRFYSSSLLIIYEGDSASCASTIPPEPRPPAASPSSTTQPSPMTPPPPMTSPSPTLQSPVDVRMIDFEHNTCPYFTRTKNDPAHIGHDRGYAEGVANLIDILDTLLNDQSAANDSRILATDQSTNHSLASDQSTNDSLPVDPSATSEVACGDDRSAPRVSFAVDQSPNGDHVTMNQSESSCLNLGELRKIEQSPADQPQNDASMISLVDR